MSGKNKELITSALWSETENDYEAIVMNEPAIY